METTITPINGKEIIARIVLAPKDIDVVTGYPKDNFISLRANERGISFLRKQWMGDETFLSRGKRRAKQYSQGKKNKRQEFVGWMEGQVQQIQAIAPDIIRFSIDEPVDSPEHVTIEFHKRGGTVRGIVTDAEILDIMDELFHLLKYVRA